MPNLDSELREQDSAVAIHTKNLQLLMTEMYKAKNGLKVNDLRYIGFVYK